MARKKKILKRKRRVLKKDTKSEIETVKHMLLHLEDEYRKANISDKSYTELKEKYNHKLERLVSGGMGSEPQIVMDGGKEGKKQKKKGGLLGKLLGGKRGEEKKDEKKPEKKGEEKKEKRLEPGEIEEVTPEVIEKLASQMAGDEGVSADDVGGDEPEQLKEPEEAAAEAGQGGLSAAAASKLKVELEKLKVMIETIRESKHVTDETIQTISETIGEMRSMIFQTDATLKENLAKMERLEDDVAGVRPQEMNKRLREMDGIFEKLNLEIEKLETKATNQGERLNEAVEMLKSLGGVENLLHLNKKLQEKLKDIKEAEQYIERIGNKIEKIYIDLNRGIEDIVLIRAKQEDFENGLKDMVKSIDSLNVKLGNYVTKKDMEEIREEIILMDKKIDELNKVIPIAELKIPEELLNLRKEREDIKMFMEAAEEQLKNKEITQEEYETIKSGNMKKLNELTEKIKKEWEKFEKSAKVKKPEGEKAVSTEQPVEQETVTEPTEEEQPTEEVSTKKAESLIEPSEATKEDLGIVEEKPKPKKEKKPEAKPEVKKEIKEEKKEKPSPKAEAKPKKKVEEKPKPKAKKKTKAKKKKEPKKKIKKAKPKKRKVKKRAKPKPKKKPKKRKTTEAQRKKKILSSLRRL